MLGPISVMRHAARQLPSWLIFDVGQVALAVGEAFASFRGVIPNQISESVMALPESERLELARRIVESVATERRISELVSEGVRRIEDVVTGKVRGLSEEEHRRAVG